MNNFHRITNNCKSSALLKHWSRAASPMLMVSLLTLGLAGCSGGGGGGGSEVAGHFTSAEATAGSEPKQIQLSWAFSDGTPDYYTVEVNPDGVSGFTQADINGDGTLDSQDQLAGSQSSVLISLPLQLLTDFNNGIYRIVAYDGSGAEIVASDSINLLSVAVSQLIGYVKASPMPGRVTASGTASH